MMVTPKVGPADKPQFPPGSKPLTRTSRGSLELKISGMKLLEVLELIIGDSSGAIVVSTLKMKIFTKNRIFLWFYSFFKKWFSTWWVCWVRWHQCRLLDLDACRLSRLRWWLRKTSWSYKSGLSFCKRRKSSWLWTPSSGWVLARAGQPSDSSDANRRVGWSLERLWAPPSIRRRRRPMAREQQKRRVEAFRRTCRSQTAKKKCCCCI